MQNRGYFREGVLNILGENIQKNIRKKIQQEKKKGLRPRKYQAGEGKGTEFDTLHGKLT